MRAEILRLDYDHQAGLVRILGEAGVNGTGLNSPGRP